VRRGKGQITTSKTIPAPAAPPRVRYQTYYVEFEDDGRREIPSDAPVRRMWDDSKTIISMHDVDPGDHIEVFWNNQWSEGQVLNQPTRVVVEVHARMELTTHEVGDFLALAKNQVPRGLLDAQVTLLSVVSQGKVEK
jgi:hypothetical protein